MNVRQRTRICVGWLEAYVPNVRGYFKDGNLVRIKGDAVFWVLDCTDFHEGAFDILLVIADPVSHEIDVDRRTCGEALIGKHKGSAFQEELLAEPAYGKSKQQAFMQVSDKDLLVGDFACLVGPEFVADRYTIILYSHKL